MQRPPCMACKGSGERLIPNSEMPPEMNVAHAVAVHSDGARSYPGMLLPKRIAAWAYKCQECKGRGTEPHTFHTLFILPLLS